MNIVWPLQNILLLKWIDPVNAKEVMSDGTINFGGDELEKLQKWMWSQNSWRFKHDEGEGGDACK